MGLFFLQILLTEGGGGKVVCGNAPCNLTIHLLRPRTVDVVGAQTSLNMTYRNLLIESSKCGCSTGGGIAVYQHHIGLALLEHIAHTSKNTGRDIVEVLPLLHDVQVVIGLHIKDSEHLVQHLTVLAGNTNDSLEIFRIFLELLHQWAHLNGLRTGSKY